MAAVIGLERLYPVAALSLNSFVDNMKKCDLIYFMIIINISIFQFIYCKT